MIKLLPNDIATRDQSHLGHSQHLSSVRITVETTTKGVACISRMRRFPSLHPLPEVSGRCSEPAGGHAKRKAAREFSARPESGTAEVHFADQSLVAPFGQLPFTFLASLGCCMHGWRCDGVGRKLLPLSKQLCKRVANPNQPRLGRCTVVDCV